MRFVAQIHHNAGGRVFTQRLDAVLQRAEVLEIGRYGHDIAVLVCEPETIGFVAYSMNFKPAGHDPDLPLVCAIACSFRSFCIARIP